MPEINFRYQPPTAGDHLVGMAGDFSEWEILDLTDIGGIYLLMLHIEPGRYRYKLIVDGNWMPDPGHSLREPDPFGGENSLLIVENPQPPRFSWAKVAADPSLLDERRGHYLELNRLSETRCELRFNWHPSLPARLTALIEGHEYRLHRLGVTHKTELWHCLFEPSSEKVSVMVRIKADEISLCYGSEGFSGSEAGQTQLEFALKDIEIFEVPDWVRTGVVYQIFTDRFYNGDPSNDPDFSEDYYADCSTVPPPGETLPPQREYFHLVEDWKDIRGLQQSPWMPEGKPDWWSFYGGDIAGVREKIPYLVDLGVTVIYFNPLWQARSNHKYDAADFCRIDPHFGTEEEMRALVSEARALGFRIIVDVALNHTGEDFWAFRDCVEKGPDSEYWNWYDWKRWPLPEPLPPDFQPKEYYQCWWGIKDMPDLNYDLSRTHPSENYVRDIAKATPNQPLVQHLLDSIRWWLTDIGIDGFRLDVPDEVPYWFWQLFRQEVKALKPDAWIVGEIWQSAKGWVGPKYFDSVMNYAFFKDPVLEFFILGVSSSHSFRERIEEGLAQYPIQAAQSMMNLLGSHDTVRILELAKGDISRLKQALLFQMTFIGTPHIYYGDEIATLGGRDPDNRRPFNWNWEQLPAAVDLRDFCKELIALRKGQPLLTEGEFAFLELPDGLLGWQRYGVSGSVFAVMNLSTVARDFHPDQSGELLLTLGEAETGKNGFKLHSGSAVLWLQSGQAWE